MLSLQTNENRLCESTACFCMGSRKKVKKRIEKTAWKYAETGIDGGWIWVYNDNDAICANKEKRC